MFDLNSRVDRQITLTENVEMEFFGDMLPCVDLFTSHSIHVVILLAIFMRAMVANHLSHMRTDCRTCIHNVTLLAVYQSLATSIRTMVKAHPRACAMPVCRPEVAGGLGREL